MPLLLPNKQCQSRHARANYCHHRRHLWQAPVSVSSSTGRKQPPVITVMYKKLFCSNVLHKAQTKIQFTNRNKTLSYIRHTSNCASELSCLVSTLSARHEISHPSFELLLGEEQDISSYTCHHSTLSQSNCKCMLPPPTTFKLVLTSGDLTQSMGKDCFSSQRAKQ